MKKISNLIGILLIVLFLSLYLGKNNSQYYSNQKVLTDEAIVRFEKDLKEGKELKASNYLPKEKDYNNKVSKLGLKTSSLIEKAFKKSLKLVAKCLSKLEND